MARSAWGFDAASLKNKAKKEEGTRSIMQLYLRTLRSGLSLRKKARLPAHFLDRIEC